MPDSSFKKTKNKFKIYNIVKNKTEKVEKSNLFHSNVFIAKILNIHDDSCDTLYSNKWNT